MMMDLIAIEEPEVQAAIISGLATVISATIAAIVAALIGHQISGRKRLVEKLERAWEDIDFLLACEEEHCYIHKSNTGQSNKLRVRDLVRSKGKGWSGKTLRATDKPSPTEPKGSVGIFLSSPP